MKTFWIIIIGICALIIAILIFSFCKLPINPFPIIRATVERIELRTDSHSDSDGLSGKNQALLDKTEVNKVLRLINWSGYDPQITGEPCCDTYWLEIYLVGGNVIRVSEGGKNTMIVNPLIGERYWVRNQALVRYVLELIETHELVRN